jgi:beta-glucosidase
MSFSSKFHKLKNTKTPRHEGIFVCFLFIFIAVSTFSMAQNKTKEQTVSELLSKMTLEEKVGQMTNLTLASICEKNDEPLKLDPIKLKDAIVKHHIGSIQNVINHAYALEEWHSLINSIQKVSLEETRLKIPFLYCIDAVHGTNFTLNSTLFPHNLGLAATRNPELVKRCSQITAKEVRASGIRYNFSPVLDVGRQPLWPRFPETFGEDVYLTKVMGVASVTGYEGKNLNDFTSVASCMKHFVGYSVPSSGKDRAPAAIPEIQLREYFLPSFKAAIEAGAHTVMVNSAEVNGVPVHASKFLLTDILRNELNFKGVVISDWEDIKKLYERHRVAENNKESVYLSVTAGIDMCIVPFDYTFYEDLVALVKEGRITEERINASVRRILEMKYELGLFERPYVEKEAVQNFGLPEYKQTALEVAREAITLLKNESEVLPLPKNKKIMLIGRQAESLTALNGAWSYSWQGQKTQYFSKEELTLAEAIRKKTGNENLIVHKHLGEFIPNQAEKPDYIVICMGEEAYAETPGNIPTLDLDQAELESVKKVNASYPGVPIVYILMQGRPRIIREIEPLAEGILMAYWPGSRGANALADILFGDYNPCGKLPFTYPRYSGEILTYDHKWLDEAVEQVSPEYKFSYEFNPQWPFGHGLSYTQFEYGTMKLSSNVLPAQGTVRVSIEVTNTGKRAGKHTVELYSRDLYASITPSVKRLRKFKQIALEPGQKVMVEFELTKEDLSFVGNDMKWVTERGDFELMIAQQKLVLKY